ncbi:transporter [Candidatus Epulonipiscium fishelsonii]|uniref:Transporter n=1 Tax=Candidatus Epulonipiscium fishelsonii TaxID=77094 RepID=A0ACC8XJ66_9FIRM|nr:transporter [Epulopiscium sp. SCG-D08WGA-EpuloA1]OON90753.1 MAG: transporter [Epulopiscium sp. AS2M-Bin002]
MIKKLKNIPVPLLPTMVGLATLSNVWTIMGYSIIRHICMWASIIVLLFYIAKVICHFKTIQTEYSAVVPASLYAGFTMLTMIVGSYIFEFYPTVGKAIWATGLALHTIHLIYFVYKNVYKNFNIDNFVPSWFVTLAGIMVATVVGGPMNEPFISVLVVCYGFIPAFIVLPMMVYRLKNYPITTGPLFMTKAILAAPSSLFIVSCINVFKNPWSLLLYIMYVVLLITLIYILINLPKFFSFEFHPGFAGLTFPLAIACVASNKMAGFLMTKGYEDLSEIVTQIFGIQIYFTTAIIGFVVFKFASLLLNSIKNSRTSSL